VAHRPRRLITVALALLIGATACASNDPKKNGVPAIDLRNVKSSTPTPSSSGGPGASGSAGPNASGSASTGPSGAASTGPSGSARPSASASAKKLSLVMQIVNTCVKPGGSQTVNVTTSPGATVATDTLYADKKEGRTHGGAGYGPTDAKGKYSFTWTVRLGTPEGKTVTFVKALKDEARASSSGRWLVSASC
jgi:hypothetical protein